MKCFKSCGCEPLSSNLFSVGNYEPYRVGYDQTYSLPAGSPRKTVSVGAYPSATRPTGVTPVGMAGECIGQPVARPCNYETATLGGYNRGAGNPDPMYSVGSFAGSNGDTMTPKMGSGLEEIGGVRPVGLIWPLVALGVGLAGVAGATYVANSGVENITTDAGVATSLGQPIVQTTSNIATTVGLLLVAYVLFRKDIAKLMK
jgi:hypothetical protein